jgi:hypothetical protein
MLNRILKSKFAKDWVKERNKDLQREIDFSDRERTENDWQPDLINDFFHQPLPQIVKVLPEIWEDVKHRVMLDVKYDVLDKVESFEDYVNSSGFSSHIDVLFDLNQYLDETMEAVLNVLEAE